MGCGFELGQLVCLLRRFKYDVNLQAGGDPRTLYLMTSFVWEYFAERLWLGFGMETNREKQDGMQGKSSVLARNTALEPGKGWDGQDQVGCDKVHWTSERERKDAPLCSRR